ncbi:PilX N-terminal domain-containing pilus assembly protein [Psychromonas sp.]|uniref:pilus assembly PilX family protein n=1 Tax=Psychromonas sp. TaxID=1884585 RepID=UPI003565F7AC
MLKKQSGAVLVISLVILFTLTLFVLSTSQSGVVQEKMTAAVRDAHISLEIAESGLRDAEQVIDNLVGTTSFNDAGTGGRYSLGNGPADLFADANWTDSKSSAATTTISVEEARYFIEYLGLLPSADEEISSVTINGYGQTTGSGNVHGFKIVSRSMGDNRNTERIVVSFYGKRI